MKKIRYLNWCKVTLVLILTYFSLVFPFAHFHHSQDNCDLPVEISLFPHNVTQDTSEDHHKEVHHHTFDQRVDYYPRTRSIARSSSLSTDMLSICDGFINLTNIGPRPALRAFCTETLLESIYEHSFVSRGPPILT